ncbi:monovalent cation/H+ antiporter complex subunit F [Roseobacter sp. HKCCA0434]|uniref:monovalent cation/H+ antiporter complex subunit F n=1 Tax=Roseobacter sp. HKCCA0434 TaxID=3079297 RepID=UPI002905A80D|nr:monovalent cation/H+ antiporter complex subunit F [Roseobacter sp. HKCCA0434]
MIVLGLSLSGPLGWALMIGAAMMSLAGLLIVWRLLTGPSLSDRVVALDALSLLLVAFLVLFTLASRVGAYLDAAIVLSLVAFLGTVAFARFIERTVVEDEQ